MTDNVRPVHVLTLHRPAGVDDNYQEDSPPDYQAVVQKGEDFPPSYQDAVSGVSNTRTH